MRRMVEKSSTTRNLSAERSAMAAIHKGKKDGATMP
jgi:hypothetical protein